MAKSVNPDKYAKGLFVRTEEYADKVRNHYVTATNELLKLSAGTNVKDGEVFSFADNPKTSARATSVLRLLYSSVYNEVKDGVSAEWGFANMSCDELIASIFGKGAVEDNHFARWFSRNEEATNTFFTRKTNGMDLSQKVWKYTGQLKDEMELALSVSMGQGKSASEISREVRKCLQEPDRLFRRVKDKNGNLKLSKKAKAYHPGQGVYRSSYKNAMRLTRTETNMAYRDADHERWGQLDFVTGVEIQRSKNSSFACPLCSSLAGIYPKGYKFKGWHPQCLCYATPILATPDEMIDMQKKILAGDDSSDFVSMNQVDDVPKGYKDWISDNTDRINNAKSTPYFIKDNYPNGDISKGLKSTEAINAKQLKIAKDKAITEANSLMTEAKALGDIDMTSINKAMKSDSIYEIQSATKSLSKDVKTSTQKATELYKEQPSKWGLDKEFGKDSSDAFMTSWSKYTSQKANLTDSEYLKVIEKEIFYGKKNVGKYATSEKMLYFLEKEKEGILLSIEKKQIIESVGDALKLSKTSKSTTMKSLTSEWDSLVSSGATNVQLKVKATELQNYYIKLEQDRIKRMAKKASNTGVDDVSFFDAKHIANDSLNWSKVEKNKIDVLRFKYKEALIKNNNDYRNYTVLDAQNTLAEELRVLSMKYIDKRGKLSHIDGLTDIQIQEALKRYLKNEKVGGSYYSKVIGGEFKGSYSSRYKELSETLKSKGINMTKQEISLIGRYTDGSGFINGYLSGKDTGMTWSGLLDDYRIAINGALEKMPRYNGITYRGMNRYASATVQEMQDCLKTGKPYVEKCVMSTSTNIQRSDSFDGYVMLKIYGRTGSDCKMISSFITEDEVIFRSGSKFKVLSVGRQANTSGIGKSKDIWVVELEDVNL